MVFLEEQTQSVWELKFLDGIFGGENTRGDRLGSCARRQQRVKRPVGRGEILAGDPLEVGGLNPLDRGEGTVGGGEVLDSNPVAAHGPALALHCFWRGREWRGGLFCGV